MCGCVWEKKGLTCYQYHAKCIRAGEHTNGVERYYDLSMYKDSAGFRTGQTGHVPRGLHKKGPPQKQTIFLDIEDVCHTCHSLQVVGL